MAVKREQIEALLQSAGFKKDSWGHYKWSEGGNQYRIKLSRVGMRYEVKAGDAGWVRLRGAYYKDLSITPEGRIRGLKTKWMADK